MMNPEEFQWLAAVVAAHPNRTVVGRTRLQKTVKLLQSLGYPTSYRYGIHFYGPYSEDVQADISLLKALGYVTEDACTATDGSPYYLIRANPDREVPAPGGFEAPISLMAQSDPVVLELAATYDALRDIESNHEDAMHRLRRKKGSKCSDGRLEQALDLLRQLGLPVAA